MQFITIYHGVGLALAACIGIVPAAAIAQATDDSRAWALCPADFNIPKRPAFDTTLEPDQVEITADKADLTEGGVSDFWGNVVVSGREQAARADHMRYYRGKERSELDGDVRLWDKSLYLESASGGIELDEDHGTFFDADYWMPLNHARGHGEEIYHERETVTRGQTVDYTTCPTSDEFWRISASKLTLDHVEEFGTARDMVLRIKDIPVFYTPYATFPISDKRKSGFLVPSIGAGSRTGFELITPYYWNIAPEMDATFGPRVMSDRGVMLFGEYRYLFETGHGEIDAEYLPSDGGSDLGDRGIFGYQHQQYFAANRGYLDIDYTNASDEFYLEDFGTNLDITSTSYLLQRAYTSYSGSWWYATANLQAYDIVNSDIVIEPYKRLPQLRFGSHFLPENWQPNFNFTSEAVHFTRDDVNPIYVNNTTIRDVNGARYDVMPYVSFPMRMLAGYIEPKIGLRYTQYDLHGNSVLSGPDSFDDNPSRTLPFASLDSGLFFERDFHLGDGNYRQTLEPRLFYLYVPYENQNDLPIFDTTLYDISFASLFRENRFSGADRFGDANQVTLAVTSRILDMAQGRELGRLSLGQIVYFDDREVNLPGLIEEDTDVSAIVAEAATTIVPYWEAVGTIHWDPNDNRTEKLSTRLSYNHDGRILNLSYRMRRDQRRQLSTSFNPLTADLLSVEQTDVSFRWPVNRQWSVIGRWNYALPESKTLEIFGGVEYEDCCWAFRAVARRYLNTTSLTRNSTGADDKYSTGFFLQLELKGLTGIGSDTDQFLERSIRGYDQDRY